MQDIITLTPQQVAGIARVMNYFGTDVQEVRISHTDGEILVTLDGGYGVYSFYVDRNGDERMAGMGETVERIIPA